MFDGFVFRRGQVLVLQVPGNQSVQIVAVRAVSAKFPFVEQALDSATHANLVGMLLQAHRPAHFAMPTAAKHHQSGACHTCGHHAQRPTPTRLLLLFNHRTQPVTSSKA
jgi:hypothetical protein